MVARGYTPNQSVDSPGNTLTIADGKKRKPGGPAPQPLLFLALECHRPLAPPARFHLGDVDEIVFGRGTVRGQGRQVEPSGARRLVIRVPDPWMSATHATLTKVFGRWVLEDANSKNGSVLNGEPQKRAFLTDGDLIELGHTFFLFREALPAWAEDPPDQDATQLTTLVPGFRTLLPALSRTFAKLEQVARSELSVVLSGESGTGKEVVARALHALSGRPGAFVAVNCGALPETLIETELFGYRKGAFSGATEDRPGLIRAADRGTLFLDEIGDLPHGSQAAFLRVLQEREVVPVGGTRPMPVDIRLIAASHRDLDALIADEKFRGDLFARISGLRVDLPPLRERREDLGLLVGALLERVPMPQREGVTFDPKAVRAFHRYRWPLNIRELEKALAAAVVLAGENAVDLEHLPPAVAEALDPPSQEIDEPEEADDRPLSEEDEKRKEELTALLREHHGNISAVARVMGKARMQIQRWVKRFGLDPESFRR
jgi:DNA-binding NtrC family response regulator